MSQPLASFWSTSADQVFKQLKASEQGLRGDEAQQRLKRYGANSLKPKKQATTLTLLLNQFKSPIILILVFAAGLSFFLQDPQDAIIILVIVLVSGLLGFWQERGASDAVEKLLATVQIRPALLRDGTPPEVPIHNLLPAHICLLST